MRIQHILPVAALLLAACATLGMGSGLERVYVVEASGGA